MLISWMNKIILLSILVLSIAPSALVAQTPLAIDNSSPISTTMEDSQKSNTGALELFEAKYAARLDAMAMERASLDTLTLAAKWIGGLGTIVLLGFGWLIGKNINEIKEASRNQARTLFDEEMRKSADETGSLRSLFQEVRQIEDEMKRLKTELSGYSDLTNVARSATGFDPLVQYQALNREIDKRRASMIQLASGDDTIDIKETIADPEFRQRASVIFEKLISTARNGHEKGSLTIDANTLFNASKNASAADMAFVALEFLEIASAVSKRARPEIEAALVRQRLTMSAYHTDALSGGDYKAWADIAEVLTKTTGFDLHLVVSEAFNVGLHLGDPPKMAQLIFDKLPDDLKNVSYTQIIRARLLLLGGQTAENWTQGRQLVKNALTTLGKEPSSLRWCEHTAEDIAKALSIDPQMLSETLDELRRVFGGNRDPRQFVARFGASTAHQFLQMRLLSEFIEADGVPREGLPPEILEMLVRMNAEQERNQSSEPDT